ncbi:Uncharacterised protein [Streptococcus pseudoporcinus]|uniref:Phage protein n=2 Tax=Streptococcus pseudoporcinus TaxID=361101 RepID=A0A4U9YY19_9STRE|nr:Uncharacterised protein [Streptococcus pseudoporcinus]
MLAKLKSGIEVPYEELWLNDNDLSEFIGKSFDQTQRLLRKMYKDRNYRNTLTRLAVVQQKLKNLKNGEKHKMKKLFNWIFAKPKKQEKSKWTIENNGWEANAKQYDDFIAHMRGVK